MLPSESPSSEEAPIRYAGLFTRATALVVDALAINVIAVLVGAAGDLIASAAGHRGGIDVVQAVAGGGAWLIWVIVYFVWFWTLTGQTPGNRLMGIRVVRAKGGLISAPKGMLRVVATVIAALPLGAGFLPVLVDERRRGLHDRIAGTVVIWVEQDDRVSGRMPA